MLNKIRRLNFSSLKLLYNQAAKKEGFIIDDNQIKVLGQLQTLNDQIVSTHTSWKRYSKNLHNNNTITKQQYTEQQQNQQSSNWLSSFFKRKFSTSYGLQHVSGIYLYGGSGCGKSFLSNIFYNNLTIAQKERQHFNEFMGGIHAQLFSLQKQKKGYDPLVQVAINRASKTRLLFLDQFQVNDVADSSILKKLFENLLSRGLILLATSNRHPKELYLNGHQREFFLPFIDLLQQKCDIIHLTSPDYRLLMERSKDTTYITPNTPQNMKRFLNILSIVSDVKGQLKFSPVELQPIAGRKLIVEKACNNVCLFDFGSLMQAVMGDTDFRAICNNFKAIFISNMRKINERQRNIANRLIKLFDEAHYRNVKIYILADTPLEQLIIPPQNPANQQQFALVRCQSRLIQFQSKQYKNNLSIFQTNNSIAK